MCIVSLDFSLYNIHCKLFLYRFWNVWKLLNMTSFQLPDEKDWGEELYFSHCCFYMQPSHNFVKDHALITNLQFFSYLIGKKNFFRIGISINFFLTKYFLLGNLLRNIRFHAQKYFFKMYGTLAKILQIKLQVLGERIFNLLNYWMSK